MSQSAARLALILAAASLPMLAVPRAWAETAADRAQRWKELQHAIFTDRPVQDGAAVLSLDAPMRAEDAALVPITITESAGPATHGQKITGLYVVVDDNPSPMAAHFSFGPAADPHRIGLRIRVDSYTDVHAIAETADGQLFEVSKFVKAAGGCSAPNSLDAAAALRTIGQMKLRVLPVSADGSQPLDLLIHHPNYNGMQMDQVTRMYTPARFLDQVDVAYGGARVFRLDADVSMSSDPAISFAVHPKAGAELTVAARDSKNTHFDDHFDVPANVTSTAALSPLPGQGS